METPASPEKPTRVTPSSPPKKRAAGRHSGGGTLQGFARFLRQYMKAWPVLIACTIGPLNKYFQVVPTYKAHEDLLAGATSLYGFLFAAALFHYRPSINRAKLLSMLLPAILLAVSIGSLFRYATVVQDSVHQKRDLAGSLGVEASQLATGEILARSAFENIPRGTELLAWYLTSFLAAETSLVLMALAEYLKTVQRGHGSKTR
jgi:hypothetical protein